MSKTTNLNNLFGGVDLFGASAKPTNTDDLFGLDGSFAGLGVPDIPEYKASPGAKKLVSGVGKMVQDLNTQIEQQTAQRQKQLNDYNQVMDASAKAAQDLYKEEEARRKAELAAIEKAKKDAEKQAKEEAEAMADDPSKYVGDFIDSIQRNEQWDTDSDLARTDLMESKLVEYEAHMRNNLQLPEEVIEGRLKYARKEVEGLIRSDVAAAEKDGIDPDDIWQNVKKTFYGTVESHNARQAGKVAEIRQRILDGTASNDELIKAKFTYGAGRDILPGNIQPGVSTSALASLSYAERQSIANELTSVHEAEYKEMEAAQDKVEEATEGYSASIQRDLANFNYQLSKLIQEHKDANGGEDPSVAEATKIFWEASEGAKASLITDNSASIIASIAAGAVTFGVGTGLGAGGKALQTLYRGKKTYDAALATANAGKLASGLGKVVGYVGGSSAVGTGLAGGYLGASDQSNTARDIILNATDEELARFSGWQDYLKSTGGNVELAKRLMATNASDDNYTASFLTSAALSMVGPDRFMGALGSRIAAKGLRTVSSSKAVGSQVAGKALTSAATLPVDVAVEGLDEVSAQAWANSAANNQAGGKLVNTFDGAGEAFAGGAVMGGVIGGAGRAAGLVGSTGKSVADELATTSAERAGRGLNTLSDYVDAQGSVDYDGFKATVGSSLAVIQADTSLTPAERTAGIQVIYDQMLDIGKYSLVMTENQRNDFKQFMRDNYAINTNNFKAKKVFDAYQSNNQNIQDAITVSKAVEGSMDGWSKERTERAKYTMDILLEAGYLNESGAQAKQARSTDRNRFDVAQAMATSISDADTINNDLDVQVRNDIADGLRREIVGAQLRLTDAEQASAVNTPAPPTPSSTTTAPAATPQNTGANTQDEIQTENTDPANTDDGRAATDVGNESGRDDTAQQAIVSEVAGELAEGVIQQSNEGLRGTTQTSNLGGTQNNAPAPKILSSQAQGTGVTSTTNQSGQSPRLSNTSTTPRTSSGGGVGATQTERNTNSERTRLTSKRVSDPVRYSDADIAKIAETDQNLADNIRETQQQLEQGTVPEESIADAENWLASIKTTVTPKKLTAKKVNVVSNQESFVAMTNNGLLGSYDSFEEIMSENPTYLEAVTKLANQLVSDIKAKRNLDSVDYYLNTDYRRKVYRQLILPKIGSTLSPKANNTAVRNLLTSIYGEAAFDKVFSDRSAKKKAKLESKEKQRKLDEQAAANEAKQEVKAQALLDKREKADLDSKLNGYYSHLANTKNKRQVGAAKKILLIDNGSGNLVPTSRAEQAVELAKSPTKPFIEKTGNKTYLAYTEDGRQVFYRVDGAKGLTKTAADYSIWLWEKNNPVSNQTLIDINNLAPEQISEATATLSPEEQVTLKSSVDETVAANPGMTEAEAVVSIVSDEAVNPQDVSKPSDKPQHKPDGAVAVIKKLTEAVMKAIKGTALAIVSGTVLASLLLTQPQQANATVQVDGNVDNVSAVVEYTQQTKDNDGKPFIVADKTNGTLTVFSPQGVKVTEEAALFGEDIGDKAVAGQTPAGRFELTKVDTSNMEGGYADTSMSFTQNQAGENFIIHKVYTAKPEQKRQQRLDSKTSTDNRISAGCINVGANFYNTTLASADGFVLYVIPETDAYTGNRFGTTVVKPSTSIVPAEQVGVVPEAVQKGEQTVVADQAPAVIAGTKPSKQEALTDSPTIANGKSHTTVSVPEGQATPQEEAGGTEFDTLSTDTTVADTETDTESTGTGAIDGVISVAAVAVGVAYVARRRKKKGEKKKTLKAKGKEPDTNNTGTPFQPVYTPSTHAPAPFVTTAPTSVPAQTREQQIIKRLNQQRAATAEEWANYLQRTGQANQNVANLLGIIEIMLDNKLDDNSKRQLLSSTRWNEDNIKRWRGFDNKYTGKAFHWFMYTMGGATPFHDNLMTDKGVPRYGVEADANAITVSLKHIRGITTAKHAKFRKAYVEPIEEAILEIAVRDNVPLKQVRDELGDYINANHSEEAVNAQIQALQDQADKVKEYIDELQAEYDRAETTDNRRRQILTEFAKLEDPYNEQLENIKIYQGLWDGTIAKGSKNAKGLKLAGGRNAAEVADIKATVEGNYGEDVVAAITTRHVEAIRAMQSEGFAHGAVSGGLKKRINELGFEKYVPFYRATKRESDPAEEEMYTSVLDGKLGYTPTAVITNQTLRISSSFKRAGSDNPPANAIDNLHVFASEMASSIGQAQYVQALQSQYEANWEGLAIKDPTDPEWIEQVENANSNYMNTGENQGKGMGNADFLIRVPMGTTMPKMQGVRPIRGNGSIVVTDRDGNKRVEQVPMDYYYADMQIREEVGKVVHRQDFDPPAWFGYIRPVTKALSKLYTQINPLWNIRNMFNEYFERSLTMMMRDVVDANGNVIDNKELQRNFTKNNTMVYSNWGDIYRFLKYREVKTPIQIQLNEAIESGAIYTYTDVLNRFADDTGGRTNGLEAMLDSFGASFAERSAKLGSARAVSKKMADLGDSYIEFMAEAPQVASALASYITYKEAGVNTKEAANRVRDAFDPSQAPQFLTKFSALLPFLRSTGAGHYNTWRSLTQGSVSDRNEGLTVAKLVGAKAVKTLAFVATGQAMLLMLAAAMFGDDDEGNDRLATLPTSDLGRGFPIPWGGGVYYIPMGHGLPGLMWKSVVSAYKFANGTNDIGDVMADTASAITANVLPVQPANSELREEDLLQWAVLSVMPQAIKPFTETMMNRNGFTGGQLYYADTPQGQRDSSQDGRTVDDDYKAMAKTIYSATGGLLDFRPESIDHIMGAYFQGPFKAVPVFIEQDNLGKTLDNSNNASERVGVLGSLVGAGTGYDPGAFDTQRRLYDLQDEAGRIQKKYDVDGKDPDNKGKKKNADGLSPSVVTLGERMKEANATEDEIIFVQTMVQWGLDRSDLKEKEVNPAIDAYRATIKDGGDPAKDEIAIEKAYQSMDEFNKEVYSNARNLSY